MGSFDFADLFAGIGGTRAAFENQGGNCVYTCEKSEEAREVYKRNWDDTVEGENIKDVDPTEIPNHDVLLACWPCPSFSRIGKLEGLKDERGSLFYHILKTLEEKQPTAFFLENVKNVRDMDDGKILNAITDALRDVGYTIDYRVVNALDFGLPHHRERLFIVGTLTEDDITIPKQAFDALQTEAEQREALEEILVEEPREKFVASDSIQSDRRESVTDPDGIPSPSVWHENRGGRITPHPYASTLRASASWNYQLIDGYRRFTPRELLRLQGFPDSFEINPNNESRARRLTGNSIPIPMVEAVAGELLAGVNTLPTPKPRPGRATPVSD